MIEEHQWSCLRMFRRLSTILFLEYSMIVMLIYGLMCNLILMNWSLLLLPFLKFKFKKKLLGLFFFKLWHYYPQVQTYSSANIWCLYYKGTTRTCRFWIILHSHNLPRVLPWDRAPYHNTSKWSKVYSQTG